MDVAREDERIAQHLLRAERLLRTSRVPSRAKQRVRAFLIEELAKYRRGRRYPRNLAHAQLTPVFIDELGTRCAMAHLLELVGAHELVARVARTNNLARIHELARDPELLRWLDAMGLTVDEAARIQPEYCSMETRAECWCRDRRTAVSVVTAVPTSGDAGPSYNEMRVVEVLAGTVHRPGDLFGVADAYASGEVFAFFPFATTALGAMGVPATGGSCEQIVAAGAVARDRLVVALTSADCKQSLIELDPWYRENTCEAPMTGPRASTATSSDSSFGCVASRTAEGSGFFLALFAIACVTGARRCSRSRRPAHGR